MSLTTGIIDRDHLAKIAAPAEYTWNESGKEDALLRADVIVEYLSGLSIPNDWRNALRGHVIHAISMLDHQAYKASREAMEFALKAVSDLPRLNEVEARSAERQFVEGYIAAIPTDSEGLCPHFISEPKKCGLCDDNGVNAFQEYLRRSAREPT